MRNDNFNTLFDGEDFQKMLALMSEENVPNSNENRSNCLPKYPKCSPPSTTAPSMKN